jgi:hypothetical protein
MHKCSELVPGMMFFGPVAVWLVISSDLNVVTWFKVYDGKSRCYKSSLGFVMHSDEHCISHTSQLVHYVE